MHFVTFIVFLFIVHSTHGQVTFVANISDDYSGKVFISDTSAVFSKGWVSIINKRTKKQIIKVDAEELTFTLHGGKLLANIKELPYGEQSQIIYEDFNFDGKKDFAIMDGQKSCYHGPSYQIYLAAQTGFKFNSDFTQLAQEYCGMFDVNNKEKRIHTMTKSGCCWHQYSTFEVKNNKIITVSVLEEGLDPSGLFLNCIEKNLINGKMITSEHKKLALEIDNKNLILSFEFENKKKMTIFHSDNSLFYVFENATEKIELAYSDSFKYSKTEGLLTFTNANTEYKISDNKIIAKTSKKAYNMNAAGNTRQGSLEKLKTIKLQNVKM